MRRVMLFGAVALVLVGCGSKSAAPKVVQPKVFHDNKIGFSFRYPANWKVPKAGHQERISGAPTWVVGISTPNNAVGVRITVDRSMLQYGTIPEGKVANDPNGPDTLQYHHLRVSGWPSIQISRSPPSGDRSRTSVCEHITACRGVFLSGAKSETFVRLQSSNFSGRSASGDKSNKVLLPGRAAIQYKRSNFLRARNGLRSRMLLVNKLSCTT